ncbi:DUF2680 domain-containing protein [Bacillaceae bacterium W0354]
MKKRLISALIALVVSFAIIGGTQALAEDDQGVNKEVKLTTDQQAELEVLYGQLYDQHNKIIDKYVEYGVYTEEKADKIKKHMMEGHEKLKENGYIPKWDHKKKHKKD